MASGKIIKWVENKGFGFIRMDDRPGDVFVHISAFGRIPRKPKVGERVEVEKLEEDKGKFKAMQVRIPGVAQMAGSPASKSGTPSSWLGSKIVWGTAASLVVLAILFWYFRIHS